MRMRFAKGGYIPDPPDDGGRRPKLDPGEYIIRPDGSVWQVGGDGLIRLVQGSRQDDD